jgi:hypothetical protein
MTRTNKSISTLWSMLAGAAGAALIALSAQADAQYRIDPEIWAAYQTYAAAIGSTKPGAFAITEDGHSYWYVTCGAIRCSGSTTYRHDAQQSCEKEYKMPCAIFALRQEIIVTYEVRK